MPSPECPWLPIWVTTLYLARRLREGAGLEDGMGQGLLHIDMFAGLHGGHGDGRVRVIRRRHDDGVDVLLAVQHLAEIPVHGGLGVGGKDLRRVVRVHVAQGHDVLGGAGADIILAHAAYANSGNVQLFAGRGLTLTAQHVPGRNHKGGSREGRGSQEGSAGVVHGLRIEPLFSSSPAGNSTRSTRSAP